MEEEVEIQETPPLIIDDFGQQQLAYASRWTKFLGIFGMVVCGILVLIGLVFFFMPTRDNDTFSAIARYKGYRRPGFGLGLGFLGFLYMIAAVVHFFPSRYLLDFSEKIKTGLLSRDQDALNGAFQKLKDFFRYSGIVIIVIASIYIVILLFAIIAILFVRIN